jgi:pyruvate dehydrogenase E1 component beta subunit
MPNEPAGSAPSPQETRQITYFQAIFEAHQEEMARDERVVLIGEDISLYTRTGLLDGTLSDRIFSAPISENGFAGMGVGAALTGLRPVVDLTIASFVYLAMDQIVNQAGKIRYMTGGRATVPIVFRASMWHDGSNAAHHSDRPYPMLMNAPGLKIAVPATPSDVKGLLKAAIRDDDPVFVFEDNSLWFQSGPVPAGDHLVPIGVADVKREGDDVSVVTIGSTLGATLEAAAELSTEGISVEVVDPRTLVPLDEQAILHSVAKTGRLVIVDPANRTGGAAAEISAIVAEEAFESLRKPIVRVTTPDVPIPFSPALEKPLYPRKERIAAAIRKLV